MNPKPILPGMCAFTLLIYLLNCFRLIFSQSYKIDPHPLVNKCAVHVRYFNTISIPIADQILNQNVLTSDSQTVFFWTVTTTSGQTQTEYPFGYIERCSINIVFIASMKQLRKALDHVYRSPFVSKNWLHNAFILVIPDCKSMKLSVGLLIEAYRASHRLFFHYQTCKNLRVSDKIFPNAAFVPSDSLTVSPIIRLRQFGGYSIHSWTVPSYITMTSPRRTMDIFTSDHLNGLLERYFISTLANIQNWTVNPVSKSDASGARLTRGRIIIGSYRFGLLRSISYETELYKAETTLTYCSFPQDSDESKQEESSSFLSELYAISTKLLSPFDNQIWMYGLLSILATGIICSFNFATKKKFPKRSSFINSFIGNMLVAAGSLFLHQRVSFKKKRIIPVAFGSIILATVFQQMVPKLISSSRRSYQRRGGVYFYSANGLIRAGYNIAFFSQLPAEDFQLYNMIAGMKERLGIWSRDPNINKMFKPLQPPNYRDYYDPYRYFKKFIDKENKLALLTTSKEGMSSKDVNILRNTFPNKDWRSFRVWGADKAFHALFRNNLAEGQMRLTKLFHEIGLMAYWKQLEKSRAGSSHANSWSRKTFTFALSLSQIYPILLLGGCILVIAFIQFQIEYLFFLTKKCYSRTCINIFNRTTKSFKGNLRATMKKYKRRNSFNNIPASPLEE